MPFTMPNYPVLDSPFDIGGSMAKGIEMKLKDLEAKKAKARLPWESDIARAEAASKLAYANLANPQMAAGLVKNKEFMNSIADRPDIQQALVKAATSQAGGNLAVGNILNNTPNPPAQMPQEEQSFTDRLLNYITGGGGQMPQQPNQQADLQKAIANYMNPQGAQSQGQAPQQPNVAQTAPNVAQPAITQSPVDTRIATEAKEKNVVENAGKTGTIQAEQLGALEKDSQALSAQALQQKKTIEEYTNILKRSLLTGKIGGKFASWGPEAAQLIPLSNQMATAMANQLYGSGVTDSKLSAAQNMKLNPEMDRTAAFATADRLGAEADRMSEYGSFVQTLTGYGVKDANKIQQLWFAYNNDLPIYNSKKNKVNEDNAFAFGPYLQQNMNKSMSQLVKEMAEREIIARKKMQEENKKEEEKKPNPFKAPSNEITYEIKDGKLVKIGGR